MSAGKETPRQRLISMMYLVLTALLALNVSREVLDAFIVVNESVERSNFSFSKKIESSYGDFERQYQLNQSKVMPFWTKAQKAQQLSRDMVRYIEEMKAELIAFTDDIPVDSAYQKNLHEIKRMDDYVRPTHFFLGPSETGKDGHASELRERIEEYRADMLELIPESVHDRFASVLAFDSVYYDSEGQKETWAIHFFYDGILAADLTLLNKVITEIYTMEFDIVNTLLNLITADDFKYDKIAAKVLPKSQNIFEGQNYEAEIIVAAYDTTETPEVYLMNGVDSLSLDQLYQARKIENDPGITRFELPGSSVGQHSYAGIVRVRKETGDYSNYHFNGSYQVNEPSFSISPKKMNVLYADVDNPVSVSVSGINPAEVIATITAGEIVYQPEYKEWVARVPASADEVSINIQARVDGIIQPMGSSTFRVKSLPVPKALIANRDQGLVSKEVLIAAGGLEIKFPRDFDFYYPYELVSFRLNMQRGFQDYSWVSESEDLTEEMITQLRRTNRGQKVYFDEIKALGPNGELQLLDAFSLTIN